jgi:DNA-binding NarL/FixJ family response regulator
MAQRSKAAQNILAAYPPLPLDLAQWRAVVKAMGLSPQLACVAEFVLRGMSNKQIEIVTGLSEGTVKDYLQRISRRTGTCGRVQLSTHVLGLALQMRDGGRSQRKR